MNHFRFIATFRGASASSRGRRELRSERSRRPALEGLERRECLNSGGLSTPAYIVRGNHGTRGHGHLVWSPEQVAEPDYNAGNLPPTEPGHVVGPPKFPTQTLTQTGLPESSPAPTVGVTLNKIRRF